MVALALLLMLAVFAALFLTSSRYDRDASKSALDMVRLDLYSEGLSQYVQSCMVEGLWGFDDKPRNYDQDPEWYQDPSTHLLRTPTPGTTLTNKPGPDAPFDYYGGAYSYKDPSNSANDFDYYPCFWLTDPRIAVSSTAGPLDSTPRVFLHAAFRPEPASQDYEIPFDNTAYASTPSLQWKFADMDGDGRADTPWMFIRPLGNGLYIRAAVRVEDTSSRINVNTAQQPLQPIVTPNPAPPTYSPYIYEADLGDLAHVPQIPPANYLDQQEALLRKTIYGGYPWIGAATTLLGNSTFNSLMMLGQGSMAAINEETVGRFLYEMNLRGSVSTWLSALGLSLNEADYLKWGRYDVPTSTGRPGVYGTQTSTTITPQYPGGQITPMSPAAPDPEVVPNCLGMDGTYSYLALDSGNPVDGYPGRFGDLFSGLLGGGFWDIVKTKPTLGNLNTYPNPLTWKTFDPDGLVRRLLCPPIGGNRPVGVDETFDLMSLKGQTVNSYVGATGQQRYAANSGWPIGTRLKDLWPNVLQASSDQRNVQWRKLLTSYSWVLDCCPYGESPYAAQNSVSGDEYTHSFWKVDLNALAPMGSSTSAFAHNALQWALEAADRHPTISNLKPEEKLTDPANSAKMNQYIANFYMYRYKQMTPSDLAYFLQSWWLLPTQSNILEANTAFDSTALTNTTLGVPAPQSYLNQLLPKWGTPGFWGDMPTPLTKPVAYSIKELMESPLSAGHYVSIIRPSDRTYNGLFGQCRQPFITEVYMDIRFPKNVALPEGPNVNIPENKLNPDVDMSNPAGGTNNYALELYNPWDTYIYLQDWYIEIETTTYNRTKPAGQWEVVHTINDPNTVLQVDLSKASPPFIPPHGRIVVSMNSQVKITNGSGTVTPQLSDPNLILASQPYPGAGKNGPTVNLIYRPGGPTSPTYAIYDNVPGEWLREFSGDALGYGDDGNTPPIGVFHTADLSGLPQTRAIGRRDDNGFWCYQRWAEQRDAAGNVGDNTNTLGAPNAWNGDTTAPGFMVNDPWNVNLLGPNPAVPVVGVGRLLSPAELLLIPFDVPEQTGGGTMTYADAITPFTRAQDGMASPPTPTGELPKSATARFQRVGTSAATGAPVRPMLFHRSYTDIRETSPGSGILYNAPQDQTDAFVSTFQSLMDFVTVNDFEKDGWNTVSGLAGWPGIGQGQQEWQFTNPEIRVPGRLNVNTVSDWWSMSQLDLLPNIPRSWNPEATPGAQMETAFWRRLLEYRDLRDPYDVVHRDPTDHWFDGRVAITDPLTPYNRRQNAIVPDGGAGVHVRVRDAMNPGGTDDRNLYLGFEHLGELCDVQRGAALASGFVGSTYGGLWQNHVPGSIYEGMLNQQSNRRFAGSLNLLTTRSDTYMVTVRVEIIRPMPMALKNLPYSADYLNDPGQLDNLTRIDKLGQREYMYLVDRSFCTQPPQENRNIYGQNRDAYGHVVPWNYSDTNYNGYLHRDAAGKLDFIPPRMWRMTVPSYLAY